MSFRSFCIKAAAIVIIALLLPIIYGHPVAAAPTIFHDAFNTYPVNSTGDPVWDNDAVSWTIANGSFNGVSMDRSVAVCTQAKRGSSMEIEVTLQVNKTVSHSWKVTGIVIQDDASNYWHLALIESPDPDKHHFVELQECYKGTWQAASTGDFKLSPLPATSYDWQYNHPYRLHLSLTHETITGTVKEQDGTLRAQAGYKLDNKAVTTGKAGLAVSGFDTDFKDFDVNAHDTVPDPIPPKMSPYTVKGYVGIHNKKTGYFHVETKNGRSWLISPAGDGFFAVGADHVNYNAHWCEKLGYAPYHKNCVSKYHDNEKAWGKTTARRLKSWNFNALGVNPSESVANQGLPREVIVGIGTSFAAHDAIAKQENWTGFPNVFSPRWEAFCKHKASEICKPLKSAPWLIGYFIDNELEWYGKDNKPWGLFDECLKKPAGDSAKTAMIDYLKSRYQSIEALNNAWQTKIKSWDSLANSTDMIESITSQAEKDRMGFVKLIAERYFSVTRAAMHEADQHHMDLGCRFAGTAPLPVIETAGKYCDIVSVNYYGNVDLQNGITTDMPAAFNKYHALCKRPMIITEWSFPAYDSGLPCIHGAGQRVATQEQKAECFRVYQTAIMRLPYLVGSNYFMYIDEPALGISSTFPEDSNYGLVDEKDNPWATLVHMASQVNSQVYALHSGLSPNISVSIAKGNGGNAKIVTRNSGRSATSLILHVWVDGKEHKYPITIAAAKSTTIPVALSKSRSAHLVTAIADPEKRLLTIDRSHLKAAAVLYNGPKTPGLQPVVICNTSPVTLKNTVHSEMLQDITRDNLSNEDVSDYRIIEPVSGAALPSQIDGKGFYTEISFTIDSIPAYACKTYYLAKNASHKNYEDTSDRDLHYNTGSIVLHHERANPDLLNTVSIGNISLGRFAGLLEQKVDRSSWIGANKIESIVVHDGPVRWSADITISFINGALGGPYKFKACYRLSANKGHSWFTSRLLWIENTDSSTWQLASYYHYCISAIGGTNASDIPATMLPDGAAAWYNSALGVYYGCFAPKSSGFSAMYWKDNDGEHPDFWRSLNINLKPGQRFETIQPPVYVFGCKGSINDVAEIIRRIQTEGSLHADGF